MKNFSINLLAADVPNWVANSFPIIRIVIVSLIILLCISIVVVILLQPAKQEGVGAISGGTDTFFSKNKGRTREGMLLKLTIVIAVVILALALIYFATLIVYSPREALDTGAALFTK